MAVSTAEMVIVILCGGDNNVDYYNNNDDDFEVCRIGFFLITHVRTKYCAGNNKNSFWHDLVTNNLRSCPILKIGKIF